MFEVCRSAIVVMPLIALLSFASSFEVAIGAASYDRAVDAAKAVVLCTPSKSHFMVFGSADADSLDSRFEERTLVDFDRLILRGQAESNEHRIVRRGSRIFWLGCGAYTLLLTGGYPSPRSFVKNDTFAVVTVKVGEEAVMSNLALVNCASATRRIRWRGYQWAGRIEGLGVTDSFFATDVREFGGSKPNTGLRISDRACE